MAGTDSRSRTAKLSTPASALSAVEAYAFDIRGFLVLRGALGLHDLEQLRAAAPVYDGAEHWLHAVPAVASTVNDLCGANDYFQLFPSRLQELQAGGPGDGLCLRGGTEEGSSRSHGYFHHQGTRVVQGLRAVWALEDMPVDGEGGLVVVPSSHRANLPAPKALLDGRGDYECVAVSPLLRLQLQSGDCVLLCSTLLHGVFGSPPALSCVTCEYTRVFTSGEHIPSTGWEGPLSPELQALLRLGPTDPTTQEPGDHVQLGGDNGLGAVPPLLYDAARRETHLGSVDNTEERPLRSARSAAAASQRDSAETNCHGQDDVGADEHFFWDLNGYLILRGVLEPELLTAANAAVDAQAEQIAATKEHVMSAAPGAPGVIGGTEWPDGTPYSAKMQGVSDDTLLPLSLAAVKTVAAF